MAGRPKRVEDITPILLRLPPPLLTRVERCKARMELWEGTSVTRTEALWRILEAGCAALERQTPSRRPPVPRDSRRPTKDVSKVRRDMRPSSSREPVPDHITKIAAERAKAPYSGLSLDEFAQHLFDAGIYRRRGADGTEKPANRGNLKKWLDRARVAGLP